MCRSFSKKITDNFSSLKTIVESNYSLSAIEVYPRNAFLNNFVHNNYILNAELKWLPFSK